MTERADVTTTTTITTATTTSNYYYAIEIPHNCATMMETFFLERKGVKNEIETHNR